MDSNNDELLSPDEWAEEYEIILKNPPEEGDFLWTEDYKCKHDENDPDAGRIRLQIDLPPGQAPFIFARAYIPNIVGRRPNWYVYGFKEWSNRGWKVILHPRSRDEALMKFGVKSKFIHCRKLSVVRRSLTNSSIVAEVVEW